ncbi:4'-phosphopantetheinyl transferase family protein [Mucilaginibacter sp.]|uniref:4'-phosphopantetheinyl transferase family protein n=1 Tax=Mucilaginibacter sp. TaxID=1882438 RepID=UPI000CB00BCA|nr:4'-phosphopantetheinyl transferase superfamily protein [Mucilaginibacter sp.]PLW89315.1 MAG: hypothetical protein C0154_12210 [Mucilaginibacter sp.]HEK22121.1 4'-phosphopantetheinyl transferase superfamily protein [Bacteroidota bacterium]
MATLTNLPLAHVNFMPGNMAGYQLSADEVHVWCKSISEGVEMLPVYRAPLNADELARAGKYFQLKDQQRFVVSRGMQRMVLGRYLNNAPDKLEFILGDNKKPKIAHNSSEPLFYNLSHAGDRILLAVANSSVGVDVEYLDPDFEFKDILPENFSVEEAAYINETNSIERFYKLWTRKEGFLKTIGQGLGDHLSVTPALDGVHKLPQHLLKSNEDWLQQSFNIAPDHIAAVAYAGNRQLKAYQFNLI